jgi:hypothetical protein
MKKKRNILIVLRDLLVKNSRAFLLCLFMLLAAPSLIALDFTYGIKGELLFCGFSGGHPSLEGYVGEDSNGIALGSYARFSYKNILCAQPELLMALKGDVFKNSVTGKRINLTQLYLELPLLFTVSFPLPTAVPIAPRIYAGPYCGVHLFSTGKATDFDLDINPFDFGIVTGYGVEVGWFFFEIAHSVGLTSVSGNLKYDTHFLTVGFRIFERTASRRNRRASSQCEIQRSS